MSPENGGYKGFIENACFPLVPRGEHIHIPRPSKGLVDKPPPIDETAVEPEQQFTEEIPGGNLS